MKRKAPIGLDALCQIEKLPILRTMEMSEQQSSYDYTGGNADCFFGGANGGGPDTVLLDVAGPGMITRIWVTGCGGDGTMDFYFDGEETPSLHILIPDLFSGRVAPFSAPLSVDNDVSSGGFISYVPIGFAKSLKVIGNGVGYYHIGYQVYPYGTPVTPFSQEQKEKYDRVASIWNRCGEDPKPRENNRRQQATFSLPNGGSVTAMQLEGPGSIASIKLQIPQVQAQEEPKWIIVDDGRAHKGASSFKVKIAPDNEGVILRKRVDQYCEQRGRLFVDEQEVGVWYTPAGPEVYRFKDVEFSIPAEFTAGKSEIVIRTEYIESLVGYSEYHYWVDCLVGGQRVRTDELDVGEKHQEEEAAHEFAIREQIWAGIGIMGQNVKQQYPPALWTALAQVEDILNTVWLQIRWDGEVEPSVSAPIGSFFGLGAFGARPTRALLFGIDEEQTMYCYFPMPFAKSARITLVNHGNRSVEDIGLTVEYNGDYSEDMGTFKTQYRDFTTQKGTPITILETAGRGHLVGVVESRAGYVRFYLEGDEIANVDGSRSHCIHGTGTEDFYNGGWYFDRDVFSLPLHGNPVHNEKDNKDRTAMYRTFVSDPVIFRAGIRMTIEHGGGNEMEIDEKILAMYYHAPDAALAPADRFSLDSGADAHAYRAEGQVRALQLDGRLEGNHILERVQAEGQGVQGRVSFRLRIPAENQGVLLRWLTDLSAVNQRAQVYVDGIYAGEWNNRQTRGLPEIARYGDLILAERFTAGKDSVEITLVTEGETEWRAYGYEAFAIV